MTRKLESRASLSGRLRIEIHDAKTGECLRDEWIDKLIVHDGLHLLLDLLGGQNDAPTHIAVVTDNTTPAAGDTTLNVEVLRNFITRRIQGSFTITFQLFLRKF